MASRQWLPEAAACPELELQEVCLTTLSQVTEVLRGKAGQN